MKAQSIFSPIATLTSILVLVCGIAVQAEANDRQALRKASGTYGVVPGPIPEGTFKGRVKYRYNEHAEVRLKARPGRRNSKLRLNVWNGNNHITRFVKITAQVRRKGKIVRLSGGRVKGRGLLPYGVEVRKGRVLKGMVELGGKPSMKARFGLAGVDLTNANQRVRGKGNFQGER